MNCKPKGWILFLICLLLVPVSQASAQVDAKEQIRRARETYYSLKKLGLVEFQCAIKPNWELVLGDRLKTDPVAAQAALKLLTGLHFDMKFDQDGKVTVTHRSDSVPTDEKMTADFNQIFDGVQKMASGFFATWSFFTLTSPLPEVESQYRLESVGNQYRLSYKDGGADVVTDMSGDFSITELRVSSRDFNSSIRPQLNKAQQGLVLVGYEAGYQPVSGPGATHLTVQVNYQVVSGLQLPQKLRLDGSQDATSFTMELVFSDYKVKLR